MTVAELMAALEQYAKIASQGERSAAGEAARSFGSILTPAKSLKIDALVARASGRPKNGPKRR